MEMVLIKLQALITFSPFRRRTWEETISPLGSHELPSDGSGFAFRVHLRNIQNNNLGTLVNHEGPPHADDMRVQVLECFSIFFHKRRRKQKPQTSLRWMADCCTLNENWSGGMTRILAHRLALFPRFSPGKHFSSNFMSGNDSLPLPVKIKKRKIEGMHLLDKIKDLALRLYFFKK